jgi:hypothetical protein
MATAGFEETLFRGGKRTQRWQACEYLFKETESNPGPSWAQVQALPG